MSDLKTIAVTGGSGFIGRYLCAALRDEGYTVLCLGRGAPETQSDRQTDYSKASLTQALSGADAVIHLAGRRMTREDAPMDLAPFWQPNVAVIGDLVSAARTAGVQRIVLASTIATYSIPSGLPYREEAPARPINAYALSKLMAEQHLEMLTRAQGLSACALRLAAVYGHGEKGTPAMMKFIDQASRGETLVLAGNPNYVIDQLYVRDAVSAFLAALHGDARGPYNVGGGVAHRVADIASVVNEVFDNTGNLRLETDSDAAMPQTVMALDHVRADLGWVPGYDLRAGLIDMRQTREAL